ncbi:MAG: serine/threonine protein kinase [Sedimentisphaerales bacterium]|nr:serine/threonine protein kinase [Sedimentisphaerales bacterium]
MAEKQSCPECGAELPANAPHGLCPRCLMKNARQRTDQAETADSEIGDDVPASATPPGNFLPPRPEELAGQFPQLDIIKLLGQGGMGAVYKARQKQLDRFVALKILPPEVGREKAFAERFAREARSLARLNHPHIVTVYDFGRTTEGLYFFIMEFVEGTDLRHVIHSAELSPREALAIVPQICEALQFAHDEGIVHRDIKPENILLNNKGRVKIADFGLAKILGSPATVYALTQAGQRMGTPHYMAPEQIENPNNVDHRADIFSLGVVFYEMLTNELPLGRFDPPSKKVHVDVRLDEVVLRALEKEPDRRYQYASEVGADVETICSDKKARVKFTPARMTRDDVESVRHRVWIPAVGLLVIGVINCLSVIGILLSKLPDALAIFMAVQAVIIFLGAWNLMQLRSYRLAFVGSILVIFTPYLVSQFLGIWALWLLLKRPVRAAFGQEETEFVIPPKIRNITVTAVKDARTVYDRGKAEVQKIIRETDPDSQKPQDSGVAGQNTSLGMGIASVTLGIVSAIILSIDASYSAKFAYGSLCIFFSGFLGIVAIRTIENRRKHLIETGFAVVGILLALISIIRLLMMN